MFSTLNSVPQIQNKKRRRMIQRTASSVSQASEEGNIWIDRKNTLKHELLKIKTKQKWKTYQSRK
jgi:hypothetical protein